MQQLIGVFVEKALNDYVTLGSSVLYLADGLCRAQTSLCSTGTGGMRLTLFKSSYLALKMKKHVNESTYHFENACILTCS